MDAMTCHPDLLQEERSYWGDYQKGQQAALSSYQPPAGQSQLESCPSQGHVPFPGGPHPEVDIMEVERLSPLVPTQNSSAVKSP